MAVVRPSTRPTRPPETVEDRRYRLVPVPLSHRQAPLVVEPEPDELTPAQALRPLAPDGGRPPELRPLQPVPTGPAPSSAPPQPRPPGPAATSPGQALSPELALVSPELAEEARAELPAPDWTELDPPPPAKRAPAEPPRPARRPSPPPRERRHVPGPRTVHGPRGRSRARRQPQRPRIPASTFVLLGLAVFVAVTGVLPARDAPTVAAPAPPKAKAAKPRAARAALPPLVAGAVYAEGDRLRLRVGEKGRRLSGTSGALPCAPGGVAFRAAVSKDGSFRGLVRGRRTAATGTVLGRFGPRTTVSGILRVRRPECDSGPVLFVAGIPRR